ncbi:MAG: hypothetical protein KDD61_15925, partial [Bdellovibrionales bacterium]|nr:hypothetical protein [Bdellovibrionales bacterium]
IRDSLNAFLFFGYDYFSELGTEAAFRSKLRNNSVRGDIVKAEFVYDYSIFSAVTKLEWQVGRYLVSPYVNIGMNESAFNGENLHSFLGIDLGFAQTTLGVNYVDIQKNALIAIYTDESIDRANVSGWEARAQHKFSDQFRLNFQVSLLDDREIDEQIVTTKLSATIWSQL